MSLLKQRLLFLKNRVPYEVGLVHALTSQAARNRIWLQSMIARNFLNLWWMQLHWFASCIYYWTTTAVLAL